FVGSLDVLDGVEVGGNTAADVVIEYLAIGEGNIATGQSMSIMEFNVVAQGVRVRRAVVAGFRKLPGQGRHEIQVRVVGDQAVENLRTAVRGVSQNRIQGVRFVTHTQHNVRGRVPVVGSA